MYLVTIEVGGFTSCNCLAKYDEIAESYAADVANACDAKLFLVAGDVAPSFFLSSSMSVEYCFGEVTIVTYAWFFADERNIEGPPMSIFSTHWSKAAPDATADSKA